ncbi:MAG: TIGR03751 family conjugal transfer lipoprotein [Cellvibrionales bacterium]|nr:MAG: TIGR03751 family conjugal transfer lipoprotein [Cellvibrionales bacterium]
MVFKHVLRLSLALISLALLSLTMTGCASTKESVLPQDGPTMKELYEGHMADLHVSTAGPGRGQPLPRQGIDHYVGFVREAANEIDTVFPRLPNPTLVMYIFPHLSGDERTPVPGYVTTFTFYERTEYALPGEVPGRFVKGFADDAVDKTKGDQTAVPPKQNNQPMATE